MSARPRVRIPRQIRVGALAEATPGARLRCAVLACTGDEWVGADLASGALLRNQAGSRVPSPDVNHPLDVVDVVVGDAREAPDPARPEGVAIAELTMPLGTLRGRRARRLLRHLAAPERDGWPLLGRWGPSVAFEDLDGCEPSLVLVSVPEGALVLGGGLAGEPRCTICWSGVRQDLPLVDPVIVARLARASTNGSASNHRTTASKRRGGGAEGALGFHPGYALVGLGEVRGGYARKVVLSVLPS